MFFLCSGESLSPARRGGAGEVVRFDGHDVRSEFLERFFDIAREACLDGCLQVRVLLAHDPVHGRGFHARVLQLHERLAGIDRVQLLAVADEHHPRQTQFPRDAEQVSCLDGGGERAFVHHEHRFGERSAHVFPALAGEAAFGDAGVADQEPLQGFGFDVGLGGQGLGRGSGRGETLQLVAAFLQKRPGAV